QPHPRNEHHGHPAAHGSDQSIVRPEKAQALTRGGYQNLHSFLLPERFYTAKTHLRHWQPKLLFGNRPIFFARSPRGLESGNLVIAPAARRYLPRSAAPMQFLTFLTLAPGSKRNVT